jgi:hypothetical protein
MPRIKAPVMTLDEAKARLEEWRNNRSGKARIPAELWSAAVEVARKEGINRTARELRVAWDDLKRRMSTMGEVPWQLGLPAFVELVTPPASRFRSALQSWKAAVASCGSS